MSPTGEIRAEEVNKELTCLKKNEIHENNCFKTKLNRKVIVLHRNN